MAEAGGDREWLIGLRWGLLGVAAALLAVVQLGAGGLPWLVLGGLLAVGAATWREGDDEVRLLARADDEMYADKRASRAPEDALGDVRFAHAA